MWRSPTLRGSRNMGMRVNEIRYVDGDGDATRTIPHITDENSGEKCDKEVHHCRREHPAVYQYDRCTHLSLYYSIFRRN